MNRSCFNLEITNEHCPLRSKCKITLCIVHWNRVSLVRSKIRAYGRTKLQGGDGTVWEKVSFSAKLWRQTAFPGYPTATVLRTCSPLLRRRRNFVKIAANYSNDFPRQTLPFVNFEPNVSNCLLLLLLGRLWPWSEFETTPRYRVNLVLKNAKKKKVWYNGITPGERSDIYTENIPPLR